MIALTTIKANAKLIAFALVAASLFAGGWHVRGWKADADIAAKDRIIMEENARAAEEAVALKNQVIEAQNEAKKRETELRAAAAAAGSQSDGLRDDIAALRGQYDRLSADAVRERAVAVGAVLQQCSQRYGELAEKADRHANDVRTLMDAWPK